MSRATQLFSARQRSANAPARNREGYPAWERPVEEQYLQTLLTNTLGQTFYASQQELLAEAAAVHDAMLAQDPAFAARALPFARQKGLMRTQPVFGLAKLAAVDGAHFEAAFGEVILIPHDLADFTAILKSLRGGEGGRRVKRAAGRWLAERLNEYWAIKYGAEKASGYSLSDLIRVYHPKTGGWRPLFDHILGREVDLAALPQVAAFERLKRASDDAEKVAAITEGRLPHEVVTSFAGRSRAVWEALAPNLPVFALVRHLRALERHGVLDACRDTVERTLTNAEAIRNSRVLPFRFLEAAQHVETPWAKDALRAVLDLAFANIPDIEGRTAVFLDRSGSMNGRFLQAAALFGVCLMRKARLEGRMLLFDDRLEEFAVSLRDSVLSQAERITARGGTNTALPMRQLLQDRDRVDNIILITDEQQNAGCPFVDALDEYGAG